MVKVRSSNFDHAYMVQKRDGRGWDELIIDFLMFGSDMTENGSNIFLIRLDLKA